MCDNVHSRETLAAAPLIPQQQYGRAITRISELRRQQPQQALMAGGDPPVLQQSFVSPHSADPYLSRGRGRRGGSASPRAPRASSGAQRGGRTSRGRKPPRGSRSASASLDLRPDGTLYEHKWFTAAGRRVLVYNGRQHKGSSAHTMWKKIQEHCKAAGGSSPHTAASSPASSPPTARRGGKRASPPSAVSAATKGRRVVATVPAGAARPPPPARNPPPKRPPMNVGVAHRTAPGSLFVLSQADVAGQRKRRRRAASSSSSEVASEDSDDSFIIPDDDANSLSQTPSSLMSRTTSSSSLSSPQDDTDDDEESGPRSLSSSASSTTMCTPFSQQSMISGMTEEAMVSMAVAMSLQGSVPTLPASREVEVVIVSSGDDEDDARDVECDLKTSAAPPKKAPRVERAKKRASPRKGGSEDDEDETIFLRAIKKEVEASKALVASSRSSTSAMLLDESEDAPPFLPVVGGAAVPRQPRAGSAFAVVVGRRPAVAAQGTAGLSAVPSSPQHLVDIHNDIETLRPQRSGFGDPVVFQAPDVRGAPVPLVNRYEAPVELPECLLSGGDDDLFAESEIVGGYAF